ncbi:MAG: adenylosuccinate lyase [Gammaproteobacteria bacterium GWF2_41_13]|nr:MAG: adenylosuccinate lyase [Gammaproteobacteria bacterium GWF2_41_13]
MNLSTLTAISPIDGRYGEKLIDLRDLFSEFALMRYRLQVEIRWLKTLADYPEIQEISKLSFHAEQFLEKLIDQFSLQDAQRIKQIEATTQHDLKAIEYFLKEKCAHQEELMRVLEFIHFGCTSEDINNVSYALMIKTARQQYLLPLVDALIDRLTRMSREYTDVTMLARTHGQPASPTTLGKEIMNFVERLKYCEKRIIDISIFGKFNGATGNYHALSTAYPTLNWPLIAKHFIGAFDLEFNAYTTQIEPHDWMADLSNAIAHLNTVLINFCQDIWLYIAQNYLVRKTFYQEIGSSVMPHKINPIEFENAEGNLGMANALFEFFAKKLPISRLQRDLSDSTVLRNLGVAFAHSILAYQSIESGLSRLSPNKEKLDDDLNLHWEVLAEAIQTVMRRYNLPESYERLKTFSRGKIITRELLHQFIDTLELPGAEKIKLKTLTPQNYVGFANILTKNTT